MNTVETNLETRAALITGASRGLGLALAKSLAEEGWTLIIDGRDPDALAEAASELSKSTEVRALSGDVSDAEHRASLAREANEVGGLDALINNASLLGPSPQPELLDYPLEVLRKVYEVNVFAPLALAQSVRDSLKPNAVILDITSDASVQNYEGWGGYGSSKAALDQLSNILASENPSLKVYAVDPGDMRTRMHQEAFPDEDISDRPLPEESAPGLLRLLRGDLPSGRYEARELLEERRNSSGIGEFRVAVTAKDFEAAKRLYSEGLGLSVVHEWTNERGRGIILAAPNSTIEILDTEQAKFVDEIEAQGRASGPVRFAFQTDDVGGLAEALTSLGSKAVNAENPEVETPWGDSNQRLETPEGLQITLFNPPREKGDPDALATTS